MNGNVVNHLGGVTQCVVQKRYQVTPGRTPGGASCLLADGSSSHVLVTIFNPTSWSDCDAACGETGTQTHTAPCLASPEVCQTDGQGHQPALTQVCFGFSRYS